MSLKNKISVLIVGAGPSGLAMALWLQKKGISFRIIDKYNVPSETSRALAIQPRTLEFYNLLGIADEIISAGDFISEFSIRYNHHTNASIRLEEFGKSISPYPEMLLLSQNIHEKILSEKLKKLNVIVERQSELLQFTQNKFQVEAIIRSPKGDENITASYICGCDGTNSAVRRILGIKFPKKSYQQEFFIADVVASDKINDKRIQISLSRKNFCMIMPFKKMNTIRLMGLIPVESENKNNLSFLNVAHYVNESSGLEVKKVNWFSTYTANHRSASHLQQGRAFLVGDAAHSHNPAVGQGMNAGIGDAINLSWKLEAVLKGEVSNKILSTYETERISFAETLLSTTDTAFRMLFSRSFAGSFFRSPTILFLFKNLGKFKPFLRFAFKLLSQTKNHYHECALSVGFAGNIQAGDRLPWLKTETYDNYESLKSMDWHIHIYGAANENFSSVASFRGLHIHEFAWDQKAENKGFLKDAFYLIRPDGYIALIDVKQNSSVLKKYLNDWDIDHSQNLKIQMRPPENDLSL